MIPEKCYYIKYRHKFNESGLYLYKHKNAIIDFLEKSDYKNYSCFIVCGPAVGKAFGIDSWACLGTEVTPEIVDWILSNKEDFDDYGSCDFYVDYSLEEVEDSSSQDSEYDCIQLILTNTEEWLSIVEADIKECKDEEENMTPEEHESAEQFLDAIDHWMAKGRSSIREEQRGDKYMQGVKND